MNNRAIRTWAVIACLTLGLSACSESEPSSEAPATEGNGSPGEDVDAARQDRSGECGESPGVTEDAIQLGAISDLTGPVAAGGVPLADGMTAFFDYANEELDGVNGRRIEVDLRDNQYNAETTISEYRSIEPDSLAIALSYGSAPTAALSSSVERDCMATMAATWSGSDALAENVSLSASTYESSAINLVDWYVNDQGNEGAEIAVLYQGDVLGEGVLAALQYAEQEYDFSLVEQQSYAAGDQDFSGQVGAINAAEPDVVFMGATVGACFSFFGAAEASGADFDYLGLGTCYVPGVFELPIAEAYQEEVVLAWNFPMWNSDAEEAATVTDYIAEQHPSQDGQPWTLPGWEGARFVYEALVKADDAGDLTRGGVIDALRGLSEEGNEFGPPTLEYGEDSVPSEMSVVVRPDEDEPGGLRLIQDWHAADITSGFDVN